MLTVERYFPAEFLKELRQREPEGQASPQCEAASGGNVIYLAGLMKKRRIGIERHRINGSEEL